MKTLLFLLLATLLLLQTSAGRAAEPPPAPSPNAPEYRVHAGDILEISVWKEEGLNKEVLVRPDGGITFPLAGDVTVQGMTVDAITEEVIRRLGNYLADPVVTVSLKFANQRFFVVGKVNKPGDIVSAVRLNVLQAIALAGGLTPFADADDITVIHREGKRTVNRQFDYSAISRGDDLEQNITLEPGDVVVVP